MGRHSELLTQFINQTGVSLVTITHDAHQPELLAAVLDFLLTQNAHTISDCCQSLNIKLRYWSRREFLCPEEQNFIGLSHIFKANKGIIFIRMGLFDLKKTWTSWYTPFWINYRMAMRIGPPGWAWSWVRFLCQQFIEFREIWCRTPEELVKMLNEHFQYSYEELADILHNSAINPHRSNSESRSRAHQLKGDGYVLGIATNDSEDIAGINSKNTNSLTILRLSRVQIVATGQNLIHLCF